MVFKIVLFEDIYTLSLLVQDYRVLFEPPARRHNAFHNAEVQAVQTEEVSADEMWSFVSKNRNSVASKR